MCFYLDHKTPLSSEFTTSTHEASEEALQDVTRKVGGFSEVITLVAKVVHIPSGDLHTGPGKWMQIDLDLKHMFYMVHVSGFLPYLISIITQGLVGFLFACMGL